MRLISAILAFSALTLFSGQALAKSTPLVLSAGEHGTFSRVAIPSGEGETWTASQNGKSVKITLPGQTGPVNTSAIFPRRAAHRVLKVWVTQTASETILNFELNCTCTTKIYRWKGKKILIDIYGDQSAKRAKRAKPAKSSPPQIARLKHKPSPQQKFAPLDIEKARANLMERLQVAAEAGVIQMEGVEPIPETPSGLAEAADNTESILKAMDDASKGLTPENEEASKSSPHLPSTPATVSKYSAPPAEETREPQMATNIMYGYEVDLETQKFCLPDMALKLGSWRGPGSFAKELALMRGPLLGEFDAPNEDAAVLLTKFYLAHGLGEEAGLILSQYVRPEHAEAALLSDLVSIFRRKPVAPTGPILGAGECEGAHGLWQAAALGLNADWQDAAKAEKRSGDALAQLPRNIRIPLGVHIAQAALNAGQMEQVRRVLALLRRSGTIKSPALDLVEGKFALAENRQNRARSLLDPLSRSIHPQAVDATLALSRAELVSPGYLSDERLLDLSLIAMERRYTPLGRKALILTASAEAAAGRPEQALNILSREVDASSLADEKSELRDEIATTLYGLYESSSGEASLQDTDLFWRYESYLGDGKKTHTIRRGAARHLLSQGLPNAALSLLQKSGTEHGPPLMLAEALIATNQPDQALTALKPYISDPRALTLSTNALMQLGKQSEAAALIPDESKDPALLKRKADLLWSNGQWEKSARLYTQLAGTAPADLKAMMNRRITAATYMAGNDALTQETLSLLKSSDNRDLAELLIPTLKTTLPLPERVDQSLITAETVTRILKELLADG